MRDQTDKQLRVFIPFICAVVICLFVRISLGLMLFSTGILFYLIHALFYVRKIRKTGVSTSGRIVNHAYNNKGGSTPVIEFETETKEVISGRPFISSSINLSGFNLTQKEVQTEVKVLYNINNPSDFLLADNKVHDNFATVFGFVVVGTSLGFCIYDLFFEAIF